MPTSSAEPPRLEAYPGQLTSADEQLTRLASDLDTAMQDFADGAGSFLPGGFDARYNGDLVRGLRDESQYLGNWVLSVARAFRAADTDPDGDGIFSASDAILDATVGQPTIAAQRAEVEGRSAAQDLNDRLLELGIDPTNFTPEQLQRLITATGDEELQRLYQQMEGIAGNMHDPAYATGFYDVMGAEGTRTMLGVVDTFAYMHANGDADFMGNVGTTLLAPMVGGFALATRSPETEEDRAALLDTTNPVEQRHLSLLMSGNPSTYDSQWLADGADRILVTGKDLNVASYPVDYQDGMGPEEYPGFHNSTEWLYDDHALGLPTVIASRALDGNHDAAQNFLLRGSDRVHALAYPEALPMPNTPHLFEDVQRYTNELESRGASIVQFGVTHPEEMVRGTIMHYAIDAVGTEDRELNEHMYGALAAGVEDNMMIIDDRINSGWTPNESGNGFVLSEDGERRLRTTESFLSELMGNGDAADRVRSATDEYIREQLTELPTHPSDQPGQVERPRNEMHDLGRIVGVTSEADIGALERSYADAKSNAEAAGRIVDYVVGWVPGAGQVNDAGQTLEMSVGKLVEQGFAPDSEEFREGVRKIMIDYQAKVTGQPISGDDADAMLAGSGAVRPYVS
jgi:hypothetical protein